MPTYSICPSFRPDQSVHIYVGYHVWEDGDIIATVNLFDKNVKALDQCGETELAALEIAMDGADVLYHEISRYVRSHITSIMYSNARAQAASETPSLDE